MPNSSMNRKLFLPFILMTILFLAACGASEASLTQTESGSGEIDAWLQAQENEVNLAAPAAENISSDGLSASAEPAANTSTSLTASAPTPTIEIAPDPTSQETNAAGIEVGFTADGHAYKGSLDAPIIIEEFSDYQCPFCTRFVAQTLPGLVQNQIVAGEAVLIFYDFPLNRIHPQAAPAANAARCAGEYGPAAYWDMHDMLFGRAGEWENSNANATFIRYGEELDYEVDMADFAECVENGRYDKEVQADLDSGLSRGVGSTPSFFINNQPLIGAHPLETFNEVITAVLNGEEIAAAPEAEPQEVGEIVIPTPAAIPLEPEAIAFEMGDPNAPVRIVEYTDYQCPFCRSYAEETLPTLIAELVETGRVHYVMKDYPLENLHPEARAAAIAARCAGEQDAYPDMHDALFSAQDRWAGQGVGSGKIFAELAEEVGLDVAAFNTCTLNLQTDALVQANIDEAQRLGVRSTPSFFFNGYLAAGALPYQQFEQIVGWAENGELEDVIAESIRQAQQAQQAQQQQPPEPTGPVDVPIGDAFAIGDPDAPITIIEYTDFQCPFCSRYFNETFSLIAENYIETGVVRYVFKDFPLTSIHPQAVAAAEAARCAGDQDAFMEMHDLLFVNQAEWNGRENSTETFTSYAEQLGLDTAAFSACLENNTYEAAVMADLEEGIGFSVRGTPTFFINGTYLSGAQPYQVFEQAIQHFLENSE
ncbi:MAG: thioredoxin domain-containing protein [Chloroflexi bacterium]|nr:thioredoxin domain-containing protein [Chloroflexota bacterium]